MILAKRIYTKTNTMNLLGFFIIVFISLVVSFLYYRLMTWLLDWLEDRCTAFCDALVWFLLFAAISLGLTAVYYLFTLTLTL